MRTSGTLYTFRCYPRRDSLRSLYGVNYRSAPPGLRKHCKRRGCVNAAKEEAASTLQKRRLRQRCKRRGCVNAAKDGATSTPQKTGLRQRRKRGGCVNAAKDETTSAPQKTGLRQRRNGRPQRIAGMVKKYYILHRVNIALRRRSVAL
jgi:hypothetical protein